MVVSSAPTAFFQACSPLTDAEKGEKIPNTSASFGRMKARSLSASMKVKASSQAPAPVKINGSPVNENGSSHGSSPRTFINQLPDWSMLLAAVTTIFLAAEKQWMMLDWKPRRTDMVMDPFVLGRIVEDGLVFRQNFSIRSYEIGADRTASIETLLNHLQETALNHVKTAGLLGDGFGSTPEMCKKGLIWVVARMHAVVDRYPKWGDIVQIDTWVSPSGKNGMRRDWIIRDSATGDTLTRASSVWVMMNKHTRKISKMPDQVRSEIGSYFVDAAPVLEEDNRKLPKLDEKTAHSTRRGLTPKWSDLDVNQHVNNVKYIGWIMESVPEGILEGHELSGLTLEYRRECGKDNVLRSLTAVSTGTTAPVECQHLLCLDTGVELVKGRTLWRPKPVCHSASAS